MAEITSPAGGKSTASDSTERLSASIVAQAEPYQVKALAATENDEEEQWRFEPVKKRRGKDSPDEGQMRQGVLF